MKDKPIVAALVARGLRFADSISARDCVEAIEASGEEATPRRVARIIAETALERVAESALGEIDEADLKSAERILIREIARSL